jgi:hypothetical protein
MEKKTRKLQENRKSKPPSEMTKEGENKKLLCIEEKHIFEIRLCHSAHRRHLHGRDSIHERDFVDKVFIPNPLAEPKNAPTEF